MIKIKNKNDILEPRTRRNINLIKGIILAVFVGLDQGYFHLNGYVFLALFIGLFIVLELITRLIIKKLYY